MPRTASSEEIATNEYVVSLFCILGLSILMVSTSGCAAYRARKHLEGVAKGWCETIRASQVIPVYPLTEDLLPGDVFLVQTTIESQANLYRKKGFLSLDDRRTRLKGIDYSNAYFDAYWKDEFGHTPHERIKREGTGPVDGGTNKMNLSEAVAPRAAFPTYSFAAKSGFGFSAAIPVKGIPVGLNYLRTDQVRGSVTIADARTYAANELELYQNLLKWTQNDAVRGILSETVDKSEGRPVFLRVVSRVYQTGAVIVSLTRSDASGAGLSVGKAPKVSMLNTNGSLDENYKRVLEALNDTNSNPVTALKDAGAAVKFIGASESSVALAESFDRLLVIGYLGFDVPVYPGGDIGVPIPTFQRLTGTIRDPPRTVVGPLTTEQARFRVSQDALNALAQSKAPQALVVMGDVLDHLEASEFDEARRAFKIAQKARGKLDEKDKFQELLKAYRESALNYVTLAGNRGPRYAHYDQTFALAYDKKDQKQ